MSSLGDILLGFEGVIKNMQYGFDTSFSNPPAARNARKNTVYINPGSNIILEEKGMKRTVTAQVLLSLHIAPDDRTPAGATIHMAAVLEDILDAVDRSVELQAMMQLCIPEQAPFFYTDTDNSQGVGLRVLYRIKYLLERNRPDRSP